MDIFSNAAKEYRAIQNCQPGQLVIGSVMHGDGRETSVRYYFCGLPGFVTGHPLRLKTHEYVPGFKGLVRDIIAHLAIGLMEEDQLSIVALRYLLLDRLDDVGESLDIIASVTVTIDLEHVQLFLMPHLSEG